MTSFTAHRGEGTLGPASKIANDFEEAVPIVAEVTNELPSVSNEDVGTAAVHVAVSNSPLATQLHVDDVIESDATEQQMPSQEPAAPLPLTSLFRSFDDESGLPTRHMG